MNTMRQILHVAAAAALLAACVGEPTNPAIELPENRGTLLQAGEPIGTFAEFTWSADGTEILYQPDVGDPQLKAASIAGGAPRVLDGPRDEYIDLSTGPDGFIYFVADADANTRRTAYRLAPEGGTPLSIGKVGVGRAARPAVGSLVLPSPVPGVSAYVAAPDTVYIVENGQHRVIRIGCERIITFSPDGDELLCRTGSSIAGFHTRVVIATGEAEDVVVLNPNQGSPQMIYWAADGIKVFYYDFGGYFIRDVETGESQQIWPLPPAAAVLDFQNSAWTTDGSHVAFWVHSCLDRTNVGACRRGQSALHIVDLETRQDHLVAVAAGRTGGQHIAFSPDGARVAYVFEKEIFWVPVP